MAEPPRPDQPAPERPAPDQPAPAGRPVHGDQPVLPEQSPDDTDAGWGERSEPDDDERLRQDRPPHWDTA
ncbi:MAG TPA: hypothetical protein VIJ82_11345 [Streptosporangiaceae bacterium]